MTWIELTWTNQLRLILSISYNCNYIIDGIINWKINFTSNFRILFCFINHFDLIYVFYHYWLTHGYILVKIQLCFIIRLWYHSEITFKKWLTSSMTTIGRSQFSKIWLFRFWFWPFQFSNNYQTFITLIINLFFNQVSFKFYFHILFLILFNVRQN